VTLQLYILRSLLHSFLFALTGIAMIVLPTVMIQAVHKLRGVGMTQVFEYLPLVAVELVPYLLPMAFLLSVVSCFGRLAAERELTAIRMAGIHPAKLGLPALLIAAGLAFLTHHLMAEVAPNYKYQARTYLRTVRTEVFRNMPAGQSHLSFGNRSMDWVGRDEEGVLQDVTIRTEGDAGEQMVYNAKTAKIEFRFDKRGEEWLSVILGDAQYFQSDLMIKGEGVEFHHLMKELFPTDQHDRSKAKYLASSELAERRQEPGATEELRSEYLFEINRRRALSVTCLIFVLLGIPIGIGLRSGTQLAAFTSAMGIGFIYYVAALQVGKGLFQGDILSAMPAAWLVTASFVGLGCLLSFRVLWR
jgi:lipopolysaccharide export system permease protein